MRKNRASNRRSAILAATGQQAILSELSRVTTSSPEEIHQLIGQALTFERRTPRAFRQQLYAATFQTQVLGLDTRSVQRADFVRSPSLSSVAAAGLDRVGEAVPLHGRPVAVDAHLPAAAAARSG
jgi:hypothetical protein